MKQSVLFCLLFMLGWQIAFSQTFTPQPDTEAGQVSIRNLTWVGNQAFDSQMLAKVMHLPLSGKHARKDIPLRMLEQDLGRAKSDGKAQGITSFYRNQGYFFFSYQVLTTPVTNGQVDVQIRIFEGPRMKLGQVIVEGVSPLTAVEIQQLTGLISGEVFNEFRVVQSFQNLRKTRKIKGNAQVTPRLNPAEQVIDLVYSFN